MPSVKNYEIMSQIKFIVTNIPIYSLASPPSLLLALSPYW